MAYVLKNNIRPRGSELSNINVRNEEIKYVKNGEGNLFYDIQKEIIYDIPRVALIYPSIITPPEGGTNSPSYIDYRQTWRREGYSGDQYEQDEIINTGATITYSIIDGEGATVDNNGTVTWESRGVEYGASIRAATVEIQVELNGKIGKATAVVRQDKNIITNMELVNIDPGTLKPLPEFEAWEEILFIESETPAKADCQLTYSSGDISLEYEKYVDFKIEYSWESDQEYVVIDPEQIEESCTGKVLSRGIEFGKDPRTAIVTRKAKIKASLKPRYKEAEPVEEEKECTIEVVQKPNLLFIIEEEFIVTPGAIQGPDMYLAKEETKTISNIEDSKVTGVLEFSSKERVTDLDTYGTLEGPTYSWESNQEYAKVDNQNAAFTTVTMDSRGIIVGPEREAIITRHVKWVYTLDSVYGGANISDDTKFCTTTITQQANTVSIKDFVANAGSIYEPGLYPASGDTKTINGTASTISGTLEFTSEEKVTDLATYGDLTLSYSWSSSQNYASVSNINSISTSVTMDSRGAILGAERSATIIRTAHWKLTLKSDLGSGSIEDTKSCDTIVTQEANYVSSVEILLSNSNIGGHFYYNNINEKGGTVSPINNGTYRFYLKSGAGPYTSLSGVSVSVSKSYYVVSSNSFATLNTSNGNITWRANTTIEDQYVTIGSVYSVSCSDGFGPGASDSMTSTATAMMERVKIVITYSIPTINYSLTRTYIPADGKESVEIVGDVTYNQTKTISYPGTNKPNEYEQLTGPVTNYGLYNINGNKVSQLSGSHLEKNITPQTYKGYFYATVTVNGKTRTVNRDIYQEANVVTLDTRASLSYDGVDYNGGSDYPNLSHSCKVYYTSGSSENRLYGGSATYSSGTLTITTSSYSAGTAAGATFRQSDGRVKWEAHESKSSRSLTVYIDVYVTFEYVNNMFSNIIDNQYLHAASIQAGKPDLKLEGEGLSCSAIGNNELGYESGNSTSFSYEMWYSASWNIKPDEDTRIYLNDLYDYNFSITNKSYFSVDSSGVVTTLKENNGSSSRTATLTFTYTYISPNSGKYLTEDISVTIKQLARRYYLTINNTIGASILLSTNGSLDGQPSKLYDGDIIQINTSYYKTDVTDGISTKDGYITSSRTIYIYTIDGDDKLAEAGSFTYSTNKDITVSL